MLCASGLAVPVMVMVYVPGCVPEVPLALVVFIINAELTDPVPGVTPEGENEQVACAGKPVQDRETIWLNEPPISPTVTV